MYKLDDCEYQICFCLLLYLHKYLQLILWGPFHHSCCFCIAFIWRFSFCDRCSIANATNSYTGIGDSRTCRWNRHHIFQYLRSSIVHLTVAIGFPGSDIPSLEELKLRPSNARSTIHRKFETGGIYR